MSSAVETTEYNLFIFSLEINTKKLKRSKIKKGKKKTMYRAASHLLAVVPVVSLGSSALHPQLQAGQLEGEVGTGSWSQPNPLFSLSNC